MTTPGDSPVHQYEYESARRTSLATAETALGIPDALTEAETELAPYNEAYPRLQWRRGADADRVTYGKLCVHDKVSPAEFISSLLKEPARQGDWFHNFNNLPANAHFEPYQHRNGNWSNRLIKSSGQRAMASLLEHEAMAGQVDLIYMDPPYNINFRSNFQGLVDATDPGDRWQDIPLDVRHTKVFRDSYQDGVHSYLSQLRLQLLHGRELLKESGSFVMQIGPDNLHYVAVLMSEMFGHENHVATIPYRTTTNPSTSMLPEVGNWLIWFAKDKTQAKYHQLYEPVNGRRGILNLWGNAARVEGPDGESRTLTVEERNNPDLIPAECRLYCTYPSHSSHISTTGRSDTFYYHADDIPCSDNPAWTQHTCSAACRHPNNDCPKGRQCGPNCAANGYPCPTGSQWRVSPAGLHAIGLQGRLQIGPQGGVRWKHYEDEVPGRTMNAIWNSVGTVSDKIYIVETPTEVLRRVLLMTTDPGDLVLDPTCGSGAMPLMAERWGRRWIAIDSSAMSITVARQRIATAIHPYYLLQDSPAGHRREHQLEMNLLPTDLTTPFKPQGPYRNDPAAGFVLARQHEVSAATLAYGPEPDKIIRHPDRAELEAGKLRVSSAFTVESDLPFTAAGPDAPDWDDPAFPARTAEVQRAIEQSLATAGIQVPASGGHPAQTYVVSGLEATVEIPGATHTGMMVNREGEIRSALFYICGDSEVAGPFQTRNLSRAARNRGDDFAVVISFGREGDTSSVQQAQGSLIVLMVNANRDHMIPGLTVKSDDNALVVISEPDITVHQGNDGRISLAVEALTVYNPATGQVETQDSRNIVAVMTDTDYDTESFRVRLWNLPQQGRTSERRLRQIRNAFKQDIDDSKWERMRSNRTLPFPAPAGRTIAVKVVDHTGMEHMKVLTV